MGRMDHRPITFSQRLRPTARGFTAIELLVTIAILAILASLAAPSFTPLIERWRVRQVSESLQSTLYLARSEAIKRGGGVYIEKLPNNTNGCTTASGNKDWGCGWQVCTGNPCNATNVLQRYDTPAKVQVERTSAGDRITFNRWGTLDGAFLGFDLTPQGKSCPTPPSLSIRVSSGGRVRVFPSEAATCSKDDS